MLFTVIPHKLLSYSLQLQTPHYTLHLIMKFPVCVKSVNVHHKAQTEKVGTAASVTTSVIIFFGQSIQ